MQKRFHIGSKGPSPCDASKQKCPFGGETGSDNHYPTLEKAQAAFETSMKSSELFTIARDTNLNEIMRLDEEIQELESERKRIDNRLKATINKSPNFVKSWGWFKQVQERKRLAFRKRALEHDRLNLLSPENKQHELDERLKEFEENTRKRKEWFEKKNDGKPYDYHPEITTENEASARQVITSFSGLSENEVNDLIDFQMRVNDLTRTEAYRAVFKGVSIRTDKPIVAIDIETAAKPDVWVDTGAYTNIIEVGYVKRYPDGRLEEKQFLSGVPENFEKTDGTGAENIHHISTSMIKGKKPFNVDYDLQQEIMNDLKGSVLLAHNARFEVNQFTHNMWTFARDKDTEIEILDTMMVARFYTPESESSSNESFVKVTGGEYSGAHRALEDARMSLDALLRLKS